MKPHISVVVPAYNSEATLAQCLNAIFSAISQVEAQVEVIVVDDGSKDQTLAIAKKFPARVFAFPENRGRNSARQLGMEQGQGAIFINIDSDIVIPPNSLEIINSHFEENHSTLIACGMLAEPQHSDNFISTYKNSKLSFLYSRLPEKSAFLYGGVFAFRRELLPEIASEARYADDTDVAQRLASKNIYTTLLKDLRVEHLKQYSLQTLIRDDFIMGLDWAGIAARIKAWSRLHTRGTALAHCTRHFISFRHHGRLIQVYGLAASPRFLLLSLFSGVALASGSIAGILYHGISTLVRRDINSETYSAKQFICLRDNES